MKKKVASCVSLGLSLVLMSTVLTGCRFGFASDPDDPNEEVVEEPIDVSIDTFQYDSSLGGTKITLLNSKAEIQVALEKMGAEYEKKSGVHIEVMPVTDDSPYTKIVSLYNSGNPPTMSILDTTDVIALAEEKGEDLTNEAWVEEAQGGYLTEVNGKIYSLPLCIEGRGIIYNKSVIEETLGEEFKPESITTLGQFQAFLDRLVEAGMERPLSLAKEDWSLWGPKLPYIF